MPTVELEGRENIDNLPESTTALHNEKIKAF